MPNILFASNSISHFPGSLIGAQSWAYDSNRVPYAIECPLLTKCSSPKIPNSTTDEWWFHFRCGSPLWYAFSDDPLIEINDDSGDRIFALSCENRTDRGFISRLDIDGSSYTNIQYIPFANSQTRTFDVQLKFSNLQVEVRVYMNELLVDTMIIAIASWKAPDTFLIGGSTGTGTNGQTYYSEFIVADGDTRNARLDLLRPVAVGAYSDWTGIVATLSDDDPTTGMTTTIPNSAQSTILTPYTGADNISNIIQVTTSVRGINSPTQLQHLIRMSAVDYFTSSFMVPFSKDYQITDWSQNPATSLPWEASDLVSAEFGFKSIT